MTRPDLRGVSELPSDIAGGVGLGWASLEGDVLADLVVEPHTLVTLIAGINLSTGREADVRVGQNELSERRVQSESDRGA